MVITTHMFNHMFLESQKKLKNEKVPDNPDSACRNRLQRWLCVDAQSDWQDEGFRNEITGR